MGLTKAMKPQCEKEKEGRKEKIKKKGMRISTLSKDICIGDI